MHRHGAGTGHREDDVTILIEEIFGHGPTIILISKIANKDTFAANTH